MTRDTNRNPEIQQRDRELSSSAARVWVDLAKAIAWPAVTLILLCAFYSPLRATLATIPALETHVVKVRIDGKELQFDFSALPKPHTAQIAMAIDDLSPKDLEDVLKHSFKDCVTKDAKPSLVQARLIEATPKDANCYKQSPLLRDVRTYLFWLVASEMHKVTAEGPSED